MNRLSLGTALLTLLLSACSGGGDPTPPSQDEPVAVPKLAPETVVIDAATNAALSTYTFDNAASCLPGPSKLPLDATSGKLPDVRDQPFVPCQGRLTFSANTPLLSGLKTGSILVSAPVGGKAPFGYLQRVKSLSSEGGVTTVLTEQASLDEALIEGEFDQNAVLKPGNLASLTLAPGVRIPGKSGAQGTHSSRGVTLRGQDLAALEADTFAFEINSVLYDADDNPSSTGDQIRLKGNFSLTADNGISLGLKWKKVLGIPIYPKGISFRAAYGFSQQASVRVEADLQAPVDKEVELARYTFAPITFFVGPVPVVLVPSVGITADLKGNVKASLSFGASESFTAQAGFEYNGGFKNIGKLPEKAFSPFADISALAGSAEAGVNLKGDILLYGLVGPYARVRAVATFDGKIPRDPVWRLTAAAQLRAGIHADLLVKTLDYDAQVYDLPPFEFAKSGPQPPVLSITSPKDGTQVQRNGGIFGAVCVSAEDPQQGQLPAQITANGVPAGSTSGVNNCLTSLPSGVFSKVGPVQFQATVANKYGQSATATSKVTVENTPPTTHITKPGPDDVLEDGGNVYLQGYVVSGSDKIECPLPPGASLNFTSSNPADVMPSAATFCANPVATFNGKGERTLTLRATDTMDATGETKLTLDVKPKPDDGNYSPDIALLEPVIKNGAPSVGWGTVIPLKARLSDQDTSTLTYTWKYRPEKGQALKTFGGGTALGASAKTGTTVTGSFDTKLVNPPSCGNGTPFSIALEASDGVKPPVLREFEFETPVKIC